MAKTNPPAFDITVANVGDSVVLLSGATVILDGIQISTVSGNQVLVGGAWIDAANVVGTPSS